MNDEMSIFDAYRDKPLLMLAALAIWYVTQHLGEGSTFPITIPNRWKPLIVVVISALLGVGTKIAEASSWSDALNVALNAAVGAVLVHVFGAKLLTGRSDAGIPNAMKTGTSEATPPKDPPAAGGTVTRIVGGLTLLALLTGCASAAKPASCAPDTALAEESARFQAAVLAACDRAVPLSHCAAYPALKADHDAKLEGWIACRK